VLGALKGSQIGPRLSSDQREEIERAVWNSLQGPDRPGKVWKFEASGLKGQTRASAAALRGVDYKAGTELAAPVELDATHVLRPESGLYRTLRNSNVRLGPSTNHKIATTLKEGTTVEAVARIEGGKWVLVAERDRALGYIYGPLLERSEGDRLGLALAGGSARVPQICRRYDVRIVVSKREREHWGGTACRIGPAAWEVVEARALELKD
jgi:hypothetical protein